MGFWVAGYDSIMYCLLTSFASILFCSLHTLFSLKFSQECNARSLFHLFYCQRRVCLLSSVICIWIRMYSRKISYYGELNSNTWCLSPQATDYVSNGCLRLRTTRETILVNFQSDRFFSSSSACPFCPKVPFFLFSPFVFSSVLFSLTGDSSRLTSLPFPS